MMTQNQKRITIGVLSVLSLVTVLFALLFAIHAIDALGFALAEASFGTLAVIALTAYPIHTSSGERARSTRLLVSYVDIVALFALLITELWKFNKGPFVPRVLGALLLSGFIVLVVKRTKALRR